MAVTSSTLGQADGAGDAYALFAENWNTEVYQQFDRMAIMPNFVLTKNIVSGKSEHFPWIWSIDADYKARNSTLTGQAVDHNEKVISIYRPVLSDVYIDKFDEMINHFDVRSPYMRAMGLSLANILDKNCFLEGLIGSTQAANEPVNGAPGGASITDADLADVNPKTVSQALYDAAVEVGIKFDENDVPWDEQFMVVKPRKWGYLAGAIQDNGVAVSNTDFKDMELNRSAGIIRVGNVQIMKSNNFPEAEDLSANTDKYQYHQFNATNYVGLAFTRDSIGLVRRTDIFTEVEYETREQATLVVSGYYAEPGWLRPDCLIGLKIA